MMRRSGHIRERSPGSFELRWRVDGKVHTATFRGGKREAEKGTSAPVERCGSRDRCQCSGQSYNGGLARSVVRNYSGRYPPDHFRPLRGRGAALSGTRPWCDPAARLDAARHSSSLYRLGSGRPASRFRRVSKVNTRLAPQDAVCGFATRVGTRIDRSAPDGFTAQATADGQGRRGEGDWRRRHRGTARARRRNGISFGSSACERVRLASRRGMRLALGRGRSQRRRFGYRRNPSTGPPRHCHGTDQDWPQPIDSNSALCRRAIAATSHRSGRDAVTPWRASRRQRLCLRPRRRLAPKPHVAYSMVSGERPYRLSWPTPQPRVVAAHERRIGESGIGPPVMRTRR